VGSEVTAERSCRPGNRGQNEGDATTVTAFTRSGGAAATAIPPSTHATAAPLVPGRAMGRRTRMSIAAAAAAAACRSPLPFRLTAYDGSGTGRADTPFGLHIADPRALRYALGAPGTLGLARAYVAGDLEFRGVHPGDPYPAAATARRRPAIAPSHGRRSHRHPGVGRVASADSDLTTTTGGFPPLAGREGSAASELRDSASISRNYDVSNSSTCRDAIPGLPQRNRQAVRRRQFDRDDRTLDAPMNCDLDAT